MKGVLVRFRDGEWWFWTWATDGWSFHRSEELRLGSDQDELSSAQIRRRLMAKGVRWSRGECKIKRGPEMTTAF